MCSVMDLFRERSNPLYIAAEQQLCSIFCDFDKSSVKRFRHITIGCRNSNYVVETGSGKYLLRIRPPGENGYKNEKAAFEALNGLVNMPELLFTAKMNEHTCLIYEFIESISMQALLADNQKLSDEIIAQVAEGAAIIHNLKKNEIFGLEELELPPYETWYDLFLDNTPATVRLGPDVVKRVKHLVECRSELIQQIKLYNSFIHSDFRPANMLIDKENRVFFVDWEFAGFGHTLADIGQFFRYGCCFNKKHLSVFEEVYNEKAAVILPANWYDLCKLRDLVNPLQMMCAKDELPIKYKDLRAVVLETLEYFGY